MFYFKYTFTRKIVYKTINVSELETRTYLKKNPNKLLSSAQVQVSQIVLPNEQKARKIRRKVTKHNFEEMAKKHSITPLLSLWLFLGKWGMTDF